MERIKYIDALRGFTMLLVVFAHVMLKTFDIGGYNSVIGSFFLTFRMPMFFFVSGYIAYKSVDRWNLGFYCQMIKKKSFVQIIPALLFFTLFSLCFVTSSLEDIFGGIFYRGFGGYWFTFVLFEMFCIYYSASLIANHTSHYIVDITLVICSILGILWLNVSSREGVLYNLLCMENLTKYIQFFAFGILCRKYNKFFISCINSDLFRTVVISCFVLCFYLYYDENLKEYSKTLFALNHDIIVRYAGLLTIFIFFWKKRDYFDKENSFTKIMLFVGRRTLDIYLLHYFFLPKMLWLTPYLASTDMLLIQLLLSIMISTAVVGVCLLISEVIRSSNLLAYICFGVKKRYS